MGAHKQADLDDQYEVIHVATYAETDHKLTPESIMRQVVKLKKKSTALIYVTLKLDSHGIKVFNAEKNDVIESAPWEKVNDHGMIIPIDSAFEQRRFLIFRIGLRGNGSIGYQSELLIFEVDSEKRGEEILDTIIRYKGQSLDSGDVDKSGLGTIRVRRIAESGHHKGSPRKLMASKYGSMIYMLSHCLDDIERFGKRLAKCVQYDEVTGQYSLMETRVRPQSRGSLTECVRKIKFAMNLSHEFQKETPESSRKICVRLIKITFWLDEICQANVVDIYDPNAIRDVVEPLLHEATIEFIENLLPSDLQASWAKLGPAWNTPAVLWPNSLSAYMPQFKSTHRGRSLRPEVLQHFVEMDDPERMYAPPYGGDRYHERRSKTVPKATQPTFRNKDHERFYRKIQEHGGKLCFATVRHVCSKPSELYADQGEVFEIVDDINEDWWTVENYSGESGQVPRWKLRPFLLNGSHSQFRFSEHDDSASFGHPHPTFRPEEFRASTTSHPDSVFYPASSPRKKDVTRPRSCSSYADTAIPPELFDQSGPEPVVLYLSPEQIKMMKNQPSSTPIIFMPWTGQHGSPVDPRQRLSSATYRLRSRTHDERPPSRMTRGSLLSPRAKLVNYRPTIVLDSKMRPVMSN